mgnify:CR=1 FL=1
MREKGQTEVAKTLETPVFSRGIEILTEKYFLFYAVVSVVALSEICKTSENFSAICAAFSSADAITCAYMFAVVLT